MAAYRRVDGFKSPVGWLPVHGDQLRAQRSNVFTIILLALLHQAFEHLLSPVLFNPVDAA